MHYWPTSLFMRSPRLADAQKQELARLGLAGHTLSEATMYACRCAAGDVQGWSTSLTIIMNEGTHARRAYLSRPGDEEWLVLERGGFVMAENMFAFVIDALH